MRKLFFLFVVSAFFFTLFSLSAYVLAQQFCCCADVCDCSGDTCDVGSPCNWVTEAEECDEGYAPCYDAFCTYCLEFSDCEAVDSDGGVDLFTKGTCHWMICDSDHKCKEISSQTDTCIGGNSIYERWASTEEGEENYCDGERIYCDEGYECTYEDDICVEIGAKEGEYCDGDVEEPGDTEEMTCISGLKCCEECDKCYTNCPNDLCCDLTYECPSDKPYCNLHTNECQEEEPTCPRSEYDSYDKAAEGKISCDEILSGCLWKSDDKYYKVDGTEGKEVNVTLTHSGTGCSKNDLYIYGKSQYTTICSSTGRKRVDNCTVKPDTDIIVKIDGSVDQRNENCLWNLEVKCKEVCPESDSSLTGGFNSGCDQWISVTKNCEMRIGGREHISGCLFARDSKFYSLEFWVGEKIEIKLTNNGDGCENNSLHTYDYNYKTTGEPYSVEGEDEVKMWVGTPHKDPGYIGEPTAKIEVRSNSENKNCLWELDVAEVGECESLCVDEDGKDCNPFRCIDGSCSDRCDKGCGAECDSDNPCDEGWYCNSNCVCVEGLGEATINIYEGTNIVGFPGLTEDDFSECELVNYVSSTRRGCTYGDPENPPHNYFVYYNPLDDDGGDCDSNFFSADTIEEGLGYYLYANKECEITFEIPIEVEVTLHPGTNIISVPVETTLDDIASVCGDEDKIFTYYVSAKKRGCIYDDKGYFVYYNPLDDDGGDCDSNFFSDEVLRPFIGYYLYFNGKNGDGKTSCTFGYENGEFI